MMVTNCALIALLLWAGSVPVVIPKHYGHMNRKFRGQSAVKCPSGEIINNSDNVTKSGIFGEDFTYDCKAGYRSDNGMTGTMTCDKRGNWADKATCEVRCPSGENITFSNDVTQSRTVGEALYYECLDGYTSSSNNGTLTCGKNGDWAVKRPCEVCYQVKNETLDLGDNLSGFDQLQDSVLLNKTAYKVNTVAECKELCNNVSCGFYNKVFSYCFLFVQPIIFLPFDSYNATACFDKCTELIECVTMMYVEEVCILANVKQSMLPATFKFKFLPALDGRTEEKICN